ncbi:hypothetical protein [Algoriphagus sp.]|uniref:hypothetical protein n=1 Tax=Algoriphagus sp. TaxID=1872435 RepID=UPI003F6F6AE8
MSDFSNIGFDYGVRPFFMLLGDLEFSDLFKKADCRGVLYLFAKGDNDEMIPVQIAFLFQNDEPAEKFLDILIGWVEKSNNDGDAVSIDFIENNKGGYTLAISPEIGRFIDRMIPKELKNKVSPIAMVQTQFKEIDVLGTNYLNFKSNYRKAKSIAIRYVIGSKNKITKQSKKYFIKKEFNFFKEGEIPQNSTALSYKSTQEISDFDPKTLPKPPKESIEEIAERRTSEMKSLLPLTYNKLNNLWLGELQRKLSLKYDSEIIKQAICNLTIFERIKQLKDLPADFTKTGYPNRILEYLISTYESFDSYYPSDEFYSEDRVRKQIQNDIKELKTYLSK